MIEFRVRNRRGEWVAGPVSFYPLAIIAWRTRDYPNEGPYVVESRQVSEWRR